MASKTPVTILQEFMVQRHQIPNYSLICNEVGTHEPLFKYDVSGLGLRAIGSGKSKKEAKHEAARLLLLMLQEEGPDNEIKQNPILKEVNSCYSPYDDTIKDNTVGALQTFCCEHLLPNPRYDLILDTGPPHFRSFTIRCTVSSFMSEATAHTKKQAKHRCSAAMINKLKMCLSNILNLSDSSDNFQSPSNCCELAKKTAFFVFPIAELAHIFNSSYFRDSHNYSFLEEIKTKWEYAEDIPDPLDVLTRLGEGLCFELDTIQLPSKSDKLVVNIYLVSKPGWSFIGSGDNYESAVNNAAVQALEFLMVMSSN